MINNSTKWLLLCFCPLVICVDEFRHAVDKFEGQWSWGKKKTTFFSREFRWAIGAEPCVPLSLALSPSSDLEHEEQSGAPFSQLLIIKQTFLKPPDTAPTYFLPPHPPDTHSREGVQLPCIHFFYILFLDRPLAWLKSKAENVCPILPFGKCLPGETRRCHTALGNMPGGWCSISRGWYSWTASLLVPKQFFSSLSRLSAFLGLSSHWRSLWIISSRLRGLPASQQQGVGKILSNCGFSHPVVERSCKPWNKNASSAGWSQ